jgi:hypothetical protein
MRITLLAGFLAMAGISTAQELGAVQISTGWLTQDAAHVTESGEAISKIGFAPQVYGVKPYVQPPTAGANPSVPLQDMKYRLRMLNLDGSVKFDVTAAFPAAPASGALELRNLPTPPGLSPVHFVKLELMDSNGKAVSDNFYWKETVEDDLRELDTIPDVELEARVERRDAGGNCRLELKLSNPTHNIAVMANAQLRSQRTNQRVPPVYYSENYVSLLPGERRTIAIQASLPDLGGAPPRVVVDGWNVTVKAMDFPNAGGARVATNDNSRVIRSRALLN